MAEQQRIVARLEELLPDVEAYGTAQERLTALESSFPQQLRKSLLQEAIQGRLVPQDPTDESADVLLQRIHAEKEQLIKEGKIKKQKPLPPITEEEKPFAIPDSWQWVRLGEIIRLTSGQDLVPTKYTNIKKGIPYITGASQFISGQLILSRWTEYPNKFSINGDLLFTCKGTIGEMAFVTSEKVHIARQIMSLRAHIYDNIYYIKIFLSYYTPKLQKAAKSFIPGISRDDLLQIVVPLPPLAEQQRIVARLEELLPLCDGLLSAGGQA